MKIIMLGSAGFIGTNLVIKLLEEQKNIVTVVDRNPDNLSFLKSLKKCNLNLVELSLSPEYKYNELIKGQDVVYHLISSTVPTTSNRSISEEINTNVILSTNLFEACVRQSVKKVVFFSSGGTVYGRASDFPIKEGAPTNPISSYGLQKITIEKLLYLYNYIYGLDYRVIRLANPYGPYQRPNGILGAVTNFTYKALKGEEINVYGDGSVVRDYLYIEDAIRGIMNIVNGESIYHTFNLGCGYGTSINQLLATIEKVLNTRLRVNYTQTRSVDVPVNYLDISRYESIYGPLNPLELEEGIKKTADFMMDHYLI